MHVLVDKVRICCKGKYNLVAGPFWKSLKLVRDLFKKIRDTKGTFHAKKGAMKDRNGTDLTEEEDIKKSL